MTATTRSRSPRAGAEPFSAARALRTVGQVGLVGVGIGAVFAATGFGLSCGLIEFGIYCPFCGGTRMVASALRGDLAGAFHWNPMLFIGGIVLGLVSLAWVVEVAGGPKLRTPRRWGPLTQKRLYVVGGVVAAVFMLVRNLFSSLTIGMP